MNEFINILEVNKISYPLGFELTTKFKKMTGAYSLIRLKEGNTNNSSTQICVYPSKRISKILKHG